jgi:hypothetical protein
VVEGAPPSTLHKRHRDAQTTSLPVCIHAKSRAVHRRHLSVTATKLRVRRPLHHGSLASRAPVVPLPRCRGGGK